MKESIKQISLDIIKSILAGIFISIVCVIYIENRNIIGALLFSVGLICILMLDLNLYTGMVGFYKYNIGMVLILILNMLGTFLASRYILAYRYVQSDLYIAMASEKLASPIISTFIMSVVCGMLIFTGVLGAKSSHRLLPLILCVTTFVMIGANHCIADSFYMFCTGTINLDIIKHLLTCVIGNTLGSYICYICADKEDSFE